MKNNLCDRKIQKIENDLVSIVLPTYNASKSINRCIESVIKQTYENWELICCDDCSIDNTYEILKYWSKFDKRIKIMKNEKNLKAAATRNKCLKVAKGNYIAQIDDDDYMHEDRLKIQIEFLKHNDYDFIGTSMYYFDECGIWKKSSPIKYPNKRDFLIDSPFSNPSIMFKRECIENVNYYRVAKETRRGQDYDLFMRLYSCGYKGANLEVPLTYYYRGKNGYNKTTFKIRIDEFKIRWKNFKDLGLFPVGILYSLKPILLGLIPFYILEKIKRTMSKKILE